MRIILIESLVQLSYKFSAGNNGSEFVLNHSFSFFLSLSRIYPLRTNKPDTVGFYIRAMLHPPNFGLPESPEFVHAGRSASCPVTRVTVAVDKGCTSRSGGHPGNRPVCTNSDDSGKLKFCG